MPDIDLGALTIPVFVTIFGAGWGACMVYIVKPLRETIDELKGRIRVLEKRFLGLGEE